jgi:hypothetical protein
MADQEQQLPLPALAGRRWYGAIDTARLTPSDILPAPDQQPVDGLRYTAGPRSVVVLEARQVRGRS